MLHDSVVFPKLYRKLLKRFPGIEKIVADVGYKIPYLTKLIIDSGMIPVFPYKRPMGKDEFFRPYEYIYDEYYDCIICLENHILIIQQQTATDTVNTKANRIFAKTVLPKNNAHTADHAKKS